MDEQYSSVVEFVADLPQEISSVAICATSYTDTGGVARVVEQQAADLSEDGLDVEVDTLVATKDAPEGVAFHELGRFETTPYKELDKLLLPASPSGWRFLSRMKNVDLIIAHRFPFSILGYLAARIHNTVYTFWSHPSQSSDELFDGVARVWAKLQHYLETANISVRDADHVCAVSEDSKAYIESKTRRSAVLVPNRVPESRFSTVASQDTIEQQYGLKPTDTVILHVGRITPRKNIHELVTAFEDVSRRIDGCKLVLVGKENMDEYSEDVRERASDDVIFTGFADDETLAGLYERSDVYATCSLSEGWGLPLSEASRFGTPIVAYDSIPAVNSIDDALLAEDGNQDDFKEKLIRAIEGE